MKESIQSFVLINCPKCHYGMDVELNSIRLQRLAFCPCCKSTIQLLDVDASLYGSQADIESDIESLEQEFKKFEKTFQLEI